MDEASKKRLLDALATISRAFTADDLATLEGAIGAAEPEPLDQMEPHARDVLGEAALAVAFGAFSARGDFGGAMQALLAAMGLMAILADEEPNPPAEILGIATDRPQVEAEIDAAGLALERDYGRDASGEEQIAALEARILGAAITLASCTLPDGKMGKVAVRLSAARCLSRLAAGLLALNATEADVPLELPKGAP